MGYVIATLVTSIGTGMYMTVAIVFFVHSLRLSASFVGVGLTIAAAVGLGASLPAGRLADRYGAKRVLVALFAIQAVVFALFPRVESHAEFLIAVLFVSLASSASFPASQVLLSDLVAGGPRVVAAAYNRSVLNAGMSVGALLAAGALAADSRPAYDALFPGQRSVIRWGAGILLSRLVPSKSQRASAATSGTAATPRRHPLRQPRFVAAASVCGVLYLSASILDIALPLQVSQHTSAPRWMIAVLLLLNTVLAVTLQVRASGGSETVAGAARANRLAGIALLAACILFPLAAHSVTGVAVAVLTVATVLLTAGELFSSAGSWGLSYGLAPLDQQGKYLASFGLLSSMVQIVGPVLAAVVVGAGFVGWVALGIVFLGAGLAAPFITGKGKERASLVATPRVLGSRALRAAGTRRAHDPEGTRSGCGDSGAPWIGYHARGKRTPPLNIVNSRPLIRSHSPTLPHRRKVHSSFQTRYHCAATGSSPPGSGRHDPGSEPTRFPRYCRCGHTRILSLPSHPLMVQIGVLQQNGLILSYDPGHVHS